jgi:hypothetical protein
MLARSVLGQPLPPVSQRRASLPRRPPAKQVRGHGHAGHFHVLPPPAAAPELQDTKGVHTLDHTAPRAPPAGMQRMRAPCMHRRRALSRCARLPDAQCARGTPASTTHTLLAVTHTMQWLEYTLAYCGALALRVPWP